MLDTQFYVEEGKIIQQKKVFSQNAGTDIGYEKGAKMIKNHYDKNDEVSSHFVSRNMIEAILDQPGVVGIRMIEGLDELGYSTPILVGVNAKGDYVLNITTCSDDGEILKQKGIITAGVRDPGPNPPPKEDAWFA